MFGKKIREELRSITLRLAKIEAILSETAALKNVVRQPAGQNKNDYISRLESLMSNWVVVPSFEYLLKSTGFIRNLAEDNTSDSICFIKDISITNLSMSCKDNGNRDISDINVTMSLFPISHCSLNNLDGNLCPITDKHKTCRILSIRDEKDLNVILDILNENIIHDRTIILSLLKK